MIGKNAEALKGMEMAVAEGGAGWVAEHRQVLIGGRLLTFNGRSVMLQPRIAPRRYSHSSTTIRLWEPGVVL